MKCPKCQLEDREGAKFGIECNEKLDLPCPFCSHPYKPGSQFFNESGQ